jgi:predicted nucleic acid-binding protein
MILTDAGPLVALLDRREQYHRACVECVSELPPRLMTTWPAFTEAMFLLGDAGGWKGQGALWKLVDSGDLQIVTLTDEMLNRAQALMEKYRDRPMDLADATLVAFAEAEHLTEIFTLDHHDFRVYRAARGQPFRLWPETLP